MQYVNRSCDWKLNPMHDILQLADKSEVFNNNSKDGLKLLLSNRVFDEMTRFNDSEDSLKEMEVRTCHQFTLSPERQSHRISSHSSGRTCAHRVW